MKTPPPSDLASAIRVFFSQHLPLTRGLSARTIASYRDAFVLLLRFVAERHRCAVADLGLAHIGPGDVIDFLDHLETDRKNSVATRNARLAAVHSFARFVAMRYPESVENCQRLLAVPSKRGPVHTVDYLESQEIGAMLESVDTRKRNALRDRALLLTLFNTGARVQELLDIRPGDLQLDRPHVVRLRGKGRKERVCPLWPETVECLRAVLAASPDIGATNAPLFRNNRGEPLTRFGVRFVLLQYAQRASVHAPSLMVKRVHPHTYRHSAAVHLLRAGVDLVTISHWLGHASVETTNRYAAVDIETKREALERARPVAPNMSVDLSAWRRDASVLDWLEAL